MALACPYSFNFLKLSLPSPFASWRRGDISDALGIPLFHLGSSQGNKDHTRYFNRQNWILVAQILGNWKNIKEAWHYAAILISGRRYHPQGWGGKGKGWDCHDLDTKETLQDWDLVSRGEGTPHWGLPALQCDWLWFWSKYGLRSNGAIMMKGPYWVPPTGTEERQFLLCPSCLLVSLSCPIFKT